MSEPGIEFAASTLSMMQEARQTLLCGDNQDIRLAQLFQDAKDAIKERFVRIAAEPKGGPPDGT